MERCASVFVDRGWEGYGCVRQKRRDGDFMIPGKGDVSGRGAPCARGEEKTSRDRTGCSCPTEASYISFPEKGLIKRNPW